ncbi:MAG: serine/threonine-protein kinase, partial [Candidatus Xenobia bacterium]
MLKSGHQLQGRYTVERVVGRGGMGAVYLARHERLGGRPVAIKEMACNVTDPEERAWALEQYSREASILASLGRHPAIVEVMDFFEESATGAGEGSIPNQYLVMEYVDGETLQSVLSRSKEPLAWQEVVGWMLQVCDVLQFLHARVPPVIFRDLKPGNLMLDARGHLRIIDFGISRVLDPLASTNPYIRGAGTLGFAPPEQFGRGTEPRTDIYALGATLYNLLTRVVPPHSLMRQSRQVTLQPPSRHNPAIPGALDFVVMHMLELAKEDRYPPAAAAREALEGALRGDGPSTLQVDQEAETRPLMAPSLLPPERVLGALPLAATHHFRNRVWELRTLRSHLLAPETRVISIGGRAGVGKTALVARLVQDLVHGLLPAGSGHPLDVFGVVHVSAKRGLPGLRDALQPLLGERPADPGTLFRKTLDTRMVVLVVDNFEDVLAEDNSISDEPWLRFLETAMESDTVARVMLLSRRTVLLPAELEGRLGHRRAELTLEGGLSDRDAMDLLRDLDADGRLGIAHVPETLLARIAARCHGIPRTLETVVGTLRQRRTWTLQKLAEDEKALSAIADAPHRDLLETLDAGRRAVMQALAVYDRPVPETAIAALCPDLPVADLLERLLLDYSAT